MSERTSRQHNRGYMRRIDRGIRKVEPTKNIESVLEESKNAFDSLLVVTAAVAMKMTYKELLDKIPQEEKESSLSKVIGERLESIETYLENVSNALGVNPIDITKKLQPLMQSEA